MAWKVNEGSRDKTLGYTGTYKSTICSPYFRGQSINLPTLLNNSAQHMTDIRRANGERTLSMLVLKIQVCPFQQHHAGHHSIRGKGQSLKFRHQFFLHLSEQNARMKLISVKGRNPLLIISITFRRYAILALIGFIFFLVMMR